ncbi:hypothetical protein TrRE_jg11914 [Triparma retinervis]|uniref:Uncharacterized protein n=1 Tax=Triparma retinervis TaxID=2557542 RepID=A0A9W7AMZ2_9STRA|nr:hypothetical protein TrRE_jg11914 [Triparma retinervis]
MQKRGKSPSLKECTPSLKSLHATTPVSIHILQFLSLLTHSPKLPSARLMAYLGTAWLRLHHVTTAAMAFTTSLTTSSTHMLARVTELLLCLILSRPE